MRFALASVEMLLWTPLPPRRPDSCDIKGVGTTSWFLLPISTYGGSGQSVSLAMVERDLCTYGGQDAPILRHEVAKLFGVQLHDDDWNPK